MTDTTLAEAYERLLEECRRRGEIIGSTNDERRRHPRLRVTPTRLSQPLKPWRLAVDISIAGIAFYADEPCEEGQQVRIALGDQLSADAQVLACHEVPLRLIQDPARYRVRCRFANESEGLRMLVAIKNQELLHARAD